MLLLGSDLDNNCNKVQGNGINGSHNGKQMFNINLIYIQFVMD